MIEAVSWGPPEERLLWTTTDDGLERVLDEIVEGLAVGIVARPVGAIFSGDRENYIATLVDQPV